jgi:GNAT superfamily N-acetyltransferase
VIALPAPPRTAGNAIRLAGPADRNALTRLFSRVRGGAPWRGPAAAALLATGHLLVLDSGKGELGGAAHVVIAGEVGQLDLLVIDPDLLGRRLEAHFLGAAEALCEDEGASAMDVTVFAPS